MDKLHWEILDEERVKLLPMLSPFRENFYLAGGTALALLIGHRDSVDLDFFSENSFSNLELFNKLNEALIRINLAAIEDIGLMKLSAITGRTAIKDYVDLYWILQKIPLSDLIELCEKKYKNLDINLVLKSLVYFDDVIEELINNKSSDLVSFEKIKSFLRNEVETFLK